MLSCEKAYPRGKEKLGNYEERKYISHQLSLKSAVEGQIEPFKPLFRPSVKKLFKAVL